MKYAKPWDHGPEGIRAEPAKREQKSEMGKRRAVPVGG